MKIWLCVVSMLLCVQAAWAQAPAEEPPYPETGPAHAPLAIIEAGAYNFILHPVAYNCYYNPNKPWNRTRYEMAVMTAQSLLAFYPQFGNTPRNDSQLLRQRLQRSPAMLTALYYVLNEFEPELHKLGLKPDDIAQVQKELLSQGAKANQQYVNIPLGDAAYDDVKMLIQIGLVTLHPGQRDLAANHVISRHEFAVGVARVIAEAERQNERWNKLPMADRIKWPLTKNNLLAKTTPETKAALARLIERLTPELEELGFEPAHLTLAQRELEAGRTLVRLKGKADQAFNDMPPGHWAFNAVEHLRLSGIIMGDAPR